MISFLVGVLTVFMVLDCLLLILLILVQLPKKDAGAGMAFGGAATDALFGAGSGTALTMITKYVATAFFVLAMVLSILGARQKTQGRSVLEEELRKKAGKPPAAAVTPVPATNTLLQPVPAFLTNTVATNKLLAPSNPPAGTNK